MYKNYILFHNHLELNYKSFYLNTVPLSASSSNVISFHQYFRYILYQLTFFFTYSPSKYSHSYSHSQLLGFQLNPLSHIPLSISSLNLHLHLSSFNLCLLLQTLASNVHLYLQVSCHFMYLVSLVLEIRLNTLTFMFLTRSGTHNFGYGSLILLQIPLHLLILTL